MHSTEKKSRSWGWLKAAPAVVMTVLLFAAQVGPTEATAKLAEWATALGLVWPTWLTAKSFFVGLTVVVGTIYAFLFRKHFRGFGERLLRGYRAFREPPPTTAFSAALATPTTEASSPIPGSPPRTTISDRAYTNETVEVDGRTFNRCVFNNVTLLHHGTGGWTFIEARFVGNIMLKTDDPATKSFMELGALLRSMPQVARSQMALQDAATGQFRILEEVTRRVAPKPPPPSQPDPAKRKNRRNRRG